jgi:hypothetical protein
LAFEQTDLFTALTHLQAYYQALSADARRLNDLVAETKQPTSCEVMALYTSAYNDYLAFGNRLFKELNARSLYVEQVVYKNGKPVMDPNQPDHVWTIRLPAPLRPPVPATDKARCPGLPAVMAGGTEIGLPLPLLVGIVVGAIIVISTGAVYVAGHISAENLKQIRFTIQGPDYNYRKRVEDHLYCIDGLKARGIPANEAQKGCLPDVLQSQTEREQKGIGGVPVAILGLGVLVIGGGFIAIKLLQPRPATTALARLEQT